jgi:hypothetical protein
MLHYFTATQLKSKALGLGMNEIQRIITEIRQIANADYVNNLMR